jgi:hypothetical protein
MAAFLGNKIAGAWASTEIVSIPDPTIAEVLATLMDLQEMDYVFVAFFGHGYHPKGADQTSTRLVFSNGSLRVSDLHPGCDKCTMLIDAYRTEITVIEEAVKNQFKATTKIAAQLPDRQAYRDAFYARLDRCAPTPRIFMGARSERRQAMTLNMAAFSLVR